MSDVIIQSVKDILTNEEKIIGRRYCGDFEFREFKKHLKYRRSLLIILNLFIAILGVIFFYEGFQVF